MSLFKLCSIIYRLVLALAIPVLLIAKVLVGAAGHNSSTTWSDYLAFAFILITLIALTLLFRIGDQEHQAKRAFRFVSIMLVSISIAFEVYGLFDLFSDNEFSAGGIIGIAVVLLFIVISLTVLRGIIKGRSE